MHRNFRIGTLAGIGALAALMALASIGPNVPVLFVLMMLVHGFVFALMVLTIGPVSAEAVPTRLMSTASGLVIGVGEVFGGGIAPSLAGFGAKHFCIASALDIPIGALCCGLLAVALLKETAPRRAGHQASGARRSVHHKTRREASTPASNWIGRWRADWRL